MILSLFSSAQRAGPQLGRASKLGSDKAHRLLGWTATDDCRERAANVRKTARG